MYGVVDQYGLVLVDYGYRPGGLSFITKCKDLHPVMLNSIIDAEQWLNIATEYFNDQLLSIYKFTDDEEEYYLINRLKGV